MPTLAILAVKSFQTAKQRLEDELTPGPRRALAEAMLADVLVALRQAGSVAEILVVTGDHGAQRIASHHGASVLDERERGHNAAAASGIRAALEQRALERGVERTLLVPGDCPLVDSPELDQLIARPREPRSALIVPDRHGTGTNALLLTPPDSLRPAFGPGSCERHVRAAERAGTAAEVVEVPSLALDVDTPDDLEVLQATLATLDGKAAHTRGVLGQLLRSRV